MTKTFTNPYAGFTGETLRLNLNAPLTEVRTIRSVLMEQGAVQNIWALFIQHLATYVRTNNLTIADRDLLVDYINNRFTTSGLDERAAGELERRPTKGVSKVRKGEKNVTAVGK